MRLLTFISLLFLCTQGLAQTWPLVEIGTATPGMMGPCEPSIAIDPGNPAVQVAGAVLNFAYHSQDSGKTWHMQKLSSSHGVWGDPCIVAMGKEEFAYFHLSDPTGTNWASDRILDRMVCQTTKNGGQKWNDGAGIGENHPKDQDKEWAAYDDRNNLLVVAWTQFDKYHAKEPEFESNILVAVSTNRGKSFSKPVQVNGTPGTCLDDSQTTEGATPAFGPNGEIYVAWSRDEKIYLTTSTDKGKTWSEENIIAYHTGGWDMKIKGLERCNGMPVLVSDQKGGLFITYGEMVNGQSRVRFRSSLDGGTTWTEPIDIHPVGVALDTANTGYLTSQFMPWMVCDAQTGHLYTIYYHRDTPSTSRTRAWLAISKDQGATWSNHVLSAASFIPGNAVFFGDYTHISAVNGVIRPIWTEVRGRETVVLTAQINLP